MGNRCVITTKDVTKENQDKKLGVYLHWCGPRKDVEKILSECKKREIRSPEYDYSYFWARFCQIAADYCDKDGTTGIGIGLVSNLDTNNLDNGTYYIDNDFNIDRQTDGTELLIKREDRMTEQEIEAYLINNEKIGAVFGLMPAPVKKWLTDKYDNGDFSENILVYRYSDWIVWNEDPFSDDEAVAMIRR